MSYPEYESLGRYEDDTGIAFAVENPSECYDFSHIINSVAKIDGHIYTIKAVERRMHAAPWRKGEQIGLWVDLDKVEALGD